MAVSNYVSYFDALFRTNGLGHLSDISYTKRIIGSSDARFDVRSTDGTPLDVVIYENSAGFGVVEVDPTNVYFDVPGNAPRNSDFIFSMKGEQFYVYGTNAEHLAPGHGKYQSSGGFAPSGIVPGGGGIAPPTTAQQDPYPVHIATSVADYLRANLDRTKYTVSQVSDTGTGSSRTVSFSVTDTQGGVPLFGPGMVRFTKSTGSSPSEVILTVDLNVIPGNNILFTWDGNNFVAVTESQSPWLDISGHIQNQNAPATYPENVAQKLAQDLQARLPSTYTVSVPSFGTSFTVTPPSGETPSSDPTYRHLEISGNTWTVRSQVRGANLAPGMNFVIDIDGQRIVYETRPAPTYVAATSSRPIPQAPQWKPTASTNSEKTHEAIEYAINNGPDHPTVSATWNQVPQDHVIVEKAVQPPLQVLIDPAGTNLSPGVSVQITTEQSSHPQSAEKIQVVGPIGPNDVVSVIIDGKIYTVTPNGHPSSKGTPATPQQIAAAITATQNAAAAAANAAAAAMLAGIRTGGYNDPKTKPTSRVGPFHRQLAVIETHSQSPDKGRVFGIDPQEMSKETPLFRIGLNPPLAGSEVGEAFFSTNTQQGYIWDGGKWNPITPTTITSYPTDSAVVLSSTASVGEFACTEDTGNLYLYTSNGWKLLGFSQYADYNQMTTDVSQADGAVAILMNEHSLWQWDAGSNEWFCLGIRKLNSLTDLKNWTPNDSSEAIVSSTGILYMRSNNTWQPASIYFDTELNILNDLDHLTNQVAVSLDTDTKFIFDGVKWSTEDIVVFDTETILLSSTPKEGVVAIAKDTNKIFSYANGAWNASENTPITKGTSNRVGDYGHLNINNRGNLTIYDGSNWIKFPSYTSGASDPASWNGSDYGEIHEDTRKKGVIEIAGKDQWRELITEVNSVKFSNHLNDFGQRVDFRFPIPAYRYLKCSSNLYERSGSTRWCLIIFDHNGTGYNWNNLSNATRYYAENGTMNNITMVGLGSSGMRHQNAWTNTLNGQITDNAPLHGNRHSMFDLSCNEMGDIWLISTDLRYLYGNSNSYYRKKFFLVLSKSDIEHISGIGFYRTSNQATNSHVKCSMEWM